MVVQDTDDYGRTVGTVTVGGVNVEAEQAQWERSCNLTTYKQSLIRLERSGRSGLTNDENLP